MLRVLLAKDLRRAWRNPLPWLLNLALPVCITALIGLAFGGGGENNNLGRIQFAVVDDDHSILGDFLRGSANNEKSAKFLAPVYMDRPEALKELNDAKISAILFIPTNFTARYLKGEDVKLELLKNPAESIHPAVLEELLSVAVSGLNVLSRNLSSEFPAWQQLVQGHGDYREAARLIDSSGAKIQALRKYVWPPLIIYTNVSDSNDHPTAATPAAAQNSSDSSTPSAPKFNLFAYLLVGMTGMFLLLLANRAMGDLYRELRLRTFERYHTMHQRLFPFVLSKTFFTLVIVSLGAIAIMGGGSLLFRFHWQHLPQVAAVTVAYAFFTTGLMALMIALIADERRADALNNIVSMIFAMAGGCMFPPENLPAVMRDHITPLLPTNWFATAVRSLWWNTSGPWVSAGLRLAVLGAILLVAASFLFQRRLQTGTRA